MYDNLLDMKTITVREVQHRLSAVLDSVRHGQSILVTKRGKPVAKIIPAEPVRGKIVWPDFEARLTALFPKGVPPGKPLSDIVSEGRGDE